LLEITVWRAYLLNLFTFSLSQTATYSSILAANLLSEYQTYNQFNRQKIHLQHNSLQHNKIFVGYYKNF